MWVVFLISSLAETARAPFDLTEAESELVAGYQTEYSSMSFALFWLGEYANVLLMCALNAILFFGGWHFPLIAEAGSSYTGAWLVKLGVLHTKVLCVILFIMLIRWTIPRFRFDQLMALSWQVMIPLAIINLLCVMVVKEFGLSPWVLTGTSIVTFLAAAVISTRERSTIIQRPIREPVVA